MAGDRGRAATRARARDGLAMTAVVTQQLVAPVMAMQRQGHIATGAAPRVAARAANEERRPPPSVHEHDRLAPAPLHLLQRGARAWMECVAELPHVEQLDRRERAPG